ncbi:hypothetical protein F4778DRAFT_799937 [Xylariomycetidae sp. FL2044]|nr:hypothetical protein F4778DRAFT_799937 [Xylariomycetidae sp. FL2044]
MCVFLKEHPSCALYGHPTATRTTGYTRSYCAEGLAKDVFGGCDTLNIDTLPDFLDPVCAICANAEAPLLNAVQHDMLDNLDQGRCAFPLLTDARIAQLRRGCADASPRVAAPRGCEDMARAMVVAQGMSSSASSSSSSSSSSRSPSLRDEAEAWFLKATESCDSLVGTKAGMAEIFARWFGAAAAAVEIRAGLRIANAEGDSSRVRALSALKRGREADAARYRARLEYLGVWETFLAVGGFAAGGEA